MLTVLASRRILRRDSTRLHSGHLPKKLRPTLPLFARDRPIPLHRLYPGERTHRLDRSLTNQPTRSDLAGRNNPETTASDADREEDAMEYSGTVSAAESAQVGMATTDVR